MRSGSRTESLPHQPILAIVERLSERKLGALHCADILAVRAALS